MSEERVEDRIDEAVLALLWLGIFQRYPMGGARTWKSFDWNAMERLDGKDLISDPVGKGQIGDPGRSGWLRLRSSVGTRPHFPVLSCRDSRVRDGVLRVSVQTTG